MASMAFIDPKRFTIDDHIDDLNVDGNPMDYMNKSPPDDKFSEFKTLTEDDVLQLIKSSSNASCELDPIPTKLLKQCVHALLPIITAILNLSLSNGQFTELWKCALVTPLLKSAKLELIFNSFRPVSNLQYISKLSERSVATQFLDHIRERCPLPINQSSYKKFHSTETALMKIQSDILMKMDKQQVVLLVLLDLSAAFDTVDHGILLDLLRLNYGFDGTVLRWFSSYLQDRSMKVKIDNVHSDPVDLVYGVPQGSCLGPILFTVYAAPLFDIISKHLPSAHAYADDTQLYMSFHAGDETSEAHALEALELCIAEIRKWMLTFKLKINDSKTEFIIIGGRQQKLKVNIDSISVGGETIAPSTCVRNLGAMFDDNLLMDKHISKICKTGHFHLYNIRRIRKFLSKEATQTLVQASITSHLDYCNALLYGVAGYQIDKLQKLQNSAARLITFTSKWSHISPVLIDLHWLKVEFRIKYKILVFVYKSLNELAPGYLCDMINKANSYYRTSRLIVPKVKCVTFAGRSFPFAAATEWNNLPKYIKCAESFDSFKLKLKTNLFRACYNL